MRRIGKGAQPGESIFVLKLESRESESVGHGSGVGT